MATLSIGLDARTCKDGKFPVRFRLYNNNTSAYIYTGVYATQEEFTGDKYQPLKKRAYMCLERTEAITRIARKYDEVKFALEYNGTLDTLTANELREYILEKKVVRKKEVKKAGNSATNFIAWFDEYSAGRNTANAVKHYEYVGRVLREFCMAKGIRTLSFDDIEYNLLVDLKTWIRGTGRGEHTRFKVESYVRAAYREGARRFHRSRDCDPFFEYRIEKVPEGDIVTVGADVLRRLLSLDLTNQQGADSLERTRDILMASFCLGGANLTDLYKMPKARDGEAVFVRSKVSLKTKRSTRIRIEPALQRIIERNAGRERMFYWGERFESYSSFQRKTNERCKRLSALLGTTINLELIRRSFATISASMEVPSHIIDKLMGHTDQSVLDKYYAQFNWGLAATYNGRVVASIMDGIEPNSIKVPAIIKKCQPEG